MKREAMKMSCAAASSTGGRLLNICTASAIKYQRRAPQQLQNRRKEESLKIYNNLT